MWVLLADFGLKWISSFFSASKPRKISKEKRDKPTDRGIKRKIYYPANFHFFKRSLEENFEYFNQVASENRLINSPHLQV